MGRARLPHLIRLQQHPARHPNQRKARTVSGLRIRPTPADTDTNRADLGQPVQYQPITELPPGKALTVSATDVYPPSTSPRRVAHVLRISR